MLYYWKENKLRINTPFIKLKFFNFLLNYLKDKTNNKDAKTGFPNKFIDSLEEFHLVSTDTDSFFNCHYSLCGNFPSQQKGI